MSNIETHIIETPLKEMIIGVFKGGLCLLEFLDRPALEKEKNDLSRLFGSNIINAQNDLTRQTEKEIIEYFKGERTKFDLPINAPGSDFQRKIWNELINIPYGETRSYKDQAIAIGNLKAIRAVAKANGENRISIVIPCHRVIGSNGDLIGYGGGKWRKKKLLELEARIANNFEIFK